MWGYCGRSIVHCKSSVDLRAKGLNGVKEWVVQLIYKKTRVKYGKEEEDDEDEDEEVVVVMVFVVV